MQLALHHALGTSRMPLDMKLDSVLVLIGMSRVTTTRRGFNRKPAEFSRTTTISNSYKSGTSSSISLATQLYKSNRPRSPKLILT
jgi:hypothetical protein